MSDQDTSPRRTRWLMRAASMSLAVALSACTPAPDPGGADTAAQPSVDDSGQDGGDSGDTGDPGPNPLDEQLLELLATLDDPPTPLQGPGELDPALVALGEALFFDPVLSGNKDVACASCHHPEHGLGDGLVLTLGTGATGVGPARAEGEHGDWLPRHAPSLFNIGEPGQEHMFWDGRVYDAEDGPASTLGPLPEGLDSALAAQALHPVLDRGEMLGQPGDLAVDGSTNELALLEAPEEVWGGIVARLKDIDGYGELFVAAYPEREVDSMGIADVGNALAAYQSEAFQARETPFDAWLAGDLNALEDSQRLGAIIFFGSAGCVNCHSGPLLSDGRFHNSGVPQVGPGVGDAAPYDFGREGVTGDEADRYAFKTAPLRNLSTSAPYMHDGVLPDLGAVVEHYAEPENTAASFDGSHLGELEDQLHQDAEHLEDLTSHLSEDLQLLDEDSQVGLSNIRQFLLALDDASWADGADRVPDSVPSGLEVPR